MGRKINAANSEDEVITTLRGYILDRKQEISSADNDDVPE